MGTESNGTAEIDAASDNGAASQPPQSNLDRGMNKIWKAFTSLKMGLFLLSVIAAVCVYGTMHYAASSDWGDNAIPLAKARVFNAWWFFWLLGIFFLQFVISTWPVTKMSARIWWKRDFQRDPRFYRLPRGRASLKVPSGLEHIRAVLRQDFTRTHEDGNAFFAHKGLLQRIGPTVIHTGIVVILIAGLVRIVMERNGLILSEGRFFAQEGQTLSNIYAPRFMDQAVSATNLRELSVPFDIKVLDFDEVLHPNSNQPEYFSTLLQVRDKATGNVRVAKLDMNHSLRIGNLEYHQAGYFKIDDPGFYRVNFDVRDAVTGERIAVTDAGPGTRVQVGDEDLFLEVDGENPGDSWRLYSSATPLQPFAEGRLIATPRDATVTYHVHKFYPDFRVREAATNENDSGLEPFSASNVPKNPAVLISWNADGIPGEAWVFLDKQLAAAMPEHDETIQFVLEDIQIPADADFETLDWNEPGAARFVLSVTNRSTGETIERDILDIEEDGEADYTIVPQTQVDTGDAPYIVAAVERVPLYGTNLSVVREPVVPFYILGVAIIAIGATMTFMTRYRALHGLWEEETRTLHVAYVPRFGKEPDPADFQRLIRKLEDASNPPPETRASSTGDAETESAETERETAGVA
ncbi:MAG: cytochrome c biogenesis protein ResB [Sumerlaeia bacterium]